MQITPVSTNEAPDPLHWLTPDDLRLQLRGRWAVNQGKALTVNTGSQLHARFSGERLVIRFETDTYQQEPPQLWIRLDEQPWQAVEVAPLVEVAADRPHASHRLQLVFKGTREWDNRWREPLQAALIVTGVGLPESASLLEPPALPGLRAEFLGDSITEGVLVHHVDRPFPEAWPERSDGRLGYAYQTGERLGADTRVVGFGRLGVTIEGNGGVPVAADAFGWVCEGVPRDYWQPHVVVINQGSNDAGVPSERFRPAYDRYLAVVRAGYPEAHIFALRPFAGAQGDDIRELIGARVAAGDQRLHFVDTSGWVESGRHTTDAVHPNVEGHRRAAERLEAVIRSLLSRFDVPLTAVVE
jgi:lysophospholipase L1-like esterase